jgi:excisionase family DNA binding protein
MVQFLMNISEQEFKEFLKQSLKEILAEQSPAQPAEPEKMNVEQAAKFLDYEISTLYEKTSKKEIPHTKKGNRLHFYRSELIEWLKTGKVKTRSELQSEAIGYKSHSGN